MAFFIYRISDAQMIMLKKYYDVTIYISKGLYSSLKVHFVLCIMQIFRQQFSGKVIVSKILNVIEYMLLFI